DEFPGVGANFSRLNDTAWGRPLTAGGPYRVVFDRRAGLARFSIDSGATWHQGGGAFVYRTYNESDTAFFLRYYTNPNGDNTGFGKYNSTQNAHPVSQFWSISAVAIYQHSSQSTFAVQFLMDDPQSSVKYGAPASMWAMYNFTGTGYTLHSWSLSKTPTRLMEAFYIDFPKPPGALAVLNKLGHDIAVGQVAANGSVWQHMVGHSPYSVAFRQQSIATIFVAGQSGAARVQSLDSSLACPRTASYGPTVWPVPMSPVPDSKVAGISFNMLNNVWDVNFVFWYPYMPTEANFRARFRVDLADHLDDLTVDGDHQVDAKLNWRDILMASRGSTGSSGGGIYKCPHCPFITNSSQGLGRHLVHRHRPWKFACRRCGERFSQRGRRQRHELLAHGIEAGAADAAEARLKKGLKKPASVARGKDDGGSAKAARRQSLSVGPRAVPVPLDLQCRECGRQLHSGSGFRSHMCRVHPVKWAKMRRLARNRWRQFGNRRLTAGGKAKNKPAQQEHEEAEQSDEADGADSDADRISLNSSSATIQPKRRRVRPQRQRRTTSGRGEAWLTMGGRPRLKKSEAAAAADVKKEPPDLAAKQPGEKSKLLVKITRLQSLPQVLQSAQPSSRSSQPPSPQSAANCKCGHCGKVLSCRTTLLRHIRSMHRANYICMRCRRGFNRRQHAYSHITKVHRLLSRRQSAAASDATFSVSPPASPVALLDTDESVAEAAAHCLRPGQLPDKSMPPPPPPPPPTTMRLQQQQQHPSAAVSCDLDASTVSEEDALMSERHQCDLCQLSFVSAEFLASHRRLCDSFRLEEVRVLSAWSLADATAAAEAAAAGPQSTRCPFCFAEVSPARLQRHVRDAAAAEASGAVAGAGSRLHSRPQVLMCGACYEAFPGSELLQNHQVLVHLNPADRSLLGRRCPECRLWLIGDAAMAEHEAAAHSEPTMFGCQVCRTSAEPGGFGCSLFAGCTCWTAAKATRALTMFDDDSL
uniref:C2H2-type domain-containing protein n=1 Tax=Macrostomum lignano TaxID=282301 RepID=A0A1I8GMJ6_9PLAT